MTTVPMNSRQAREKFDIDLRYGQIVEDSIAAMLVSVKVEVKADDYFSTSGNVCVEYKQQRRDGTWKRSGIAVSQSQWYCFRFIDDVALIVPTEKLKAIAREMYRNPDNRIPTGRYGIKTESICIPIVRLLPCTKLHLVETRARTGP